MKPQWLILGIISVLVLIICSAEVNSDVYTTDVVYSTAECIWPESFSATYERKPCELCGKAISVYQPPENDPWSFFTLDASLPISDYESAEVVESWSFSLSHDLCADCRIIVNERLSKPLHDNYKEIWEGLLKEKAKARDDCENRRRQLHCRSLRDKITDLEEKLKELEGTKK